MDATFTKDQSWKNSFPKWKPFSLIDMQFIVGTHF